jgi:MFS superfamily sulfate permease-like transporter
MNPVLLRTDFIVAITVFAVLVPSAMAYGDLAGVTPVAGVTVSNFHRWERERLVTMKIPVK